MCGPAFVSNPYEVGKFYSIKSVFGRLRQTTGWYPVLGEAHHDKEIIRFPLLHYHIDWRFVSDALYRRHIASDRRGEAAAAAGLVLHLLPAKAVGYGLVRNIEDAPDELQTKIRRLKCKRVLPAYPHGLAPWMNELSHHHASSCLKRNVCPHRGYDLSREPVVDGVVTCPLHGLRWNVATGACIQPEAPKPQPTFADRIAAAGA